MTSNNGWHAEPELLAGYVGGSLGRASASSVEAHLVGCAACRDAMAPLVPPERLERNLVAISGRVDLPASHATGTFLERLGVPEHVARTLTVTPAARGAWFAGVGVALAIAIAARRVTVDQRTLFALLVGAPLLPLLAVSAAFASRADPARELIVSTPMSALQLLLIRSLAVLSPAIVAAVAASLVVPGEGWEAVLWLAPSLGLASTTLALGTLISLRTSAFAVGAAWVLACFVGARGLAATEVVRDSAAFRPTGQLALVVLTLVAAAVTVRRRDAFEFVDAWRTNE